MSAPSFFARWRVRLGYPLAIIVLILARPTPQSIFYGALAGMVGLLVRAMAAGHLHKQAVLTVTGPYAYTRNPLYFGSAILTLGAAIATRSWISAMLLLGYFALFYSIVMRREEHELRFHHHASFDEYARFVPLFFPRFTPVHLHRVASDFWLGSGRHIGDCHIIGPFIAQLAPATRASGDRHPHWLRRSTGRCTRRGAAKSKWAFASLAARPFSLLFPLGLALRLPSPSRLQFLAQLLVLPA